MAKTKKVEKVEEVKVKIEPTKKETHIVITGLKDGGLIEGKDYTYPIEAANHLIKIGHAKKK